MALEMRNLLVACLVAVTIVVTTICNAGKSDFSTIKIDAQAIQQDPRLEKPVSLSERRLPLNNVLNQVAAQTGIAITMDARDPASGYPILVECDQVPAGKMMDALYGLLSIRGGEWAWVRTGKAGEYKYSFHETVWAKNRTDTYNRIMKDLMSNYVSILRQLAPIKMEERKRHREELKKALFVDSDTMIDFFFENEMFWTEANFFFGALTPEQQEMVLQGGAVSLTLKNLSPSVYELYHQNYLQHNPRRLNADGTEVPVPEPDTVQIFRSSPDRRMDRIAPMIQITDRLGYMSYMGTGHLNPGVRDALKHAWMLPGDRATDPSNKIVVQEPKETEASHQEKESQKAAEEQLRRIRPDFFERHPDGLGYHLGFSLQQMAQGSGTPVLAILPAEEQDTFSTPVGKPVQQFLDRVERPNYKRYFYKWRNGVLLVNYPFWFTEPESVISYSLLSYLHPDKSEHVPIANLATLMSKISDDQAQWLAEENGIHDLKRIRPCLLFAAQYPRVLMKEGDVIDFATVRYLQSVAVLPRDAMLSEQPMRIRIQEEAAKDLPDTACRLNLEIFDDVHRKWEVRSRLSVPFFQDLTMKRPDAAASRSAK